MGFSGNFTAVTFGDDPEAEGKKALFVQGKTDATDPPAAIHVVMLRSGEPVTASAPAPGLNDWTVKFPNGNPPFAVGEDVFLVGVARRAAPQDPFVWNGSFTIASRDFP
jgi:hypothetical protein